jgi:hypothetical protein
VPELEGIARHPATFDIVRQSLAERFQQVRLLSAYLDCPIVGLFLGVAVLELSDGGAIGLAPLPAQPGDRAEWLIAPFRLGNRKIPRPADDVPGEAHDDAQAIVAAEGAGVGGHVVNRHEGGDLVVLPSPVPEQEQPVVSDVRGAEAMLAEPPVSVHVLPDVLRIGNL